MRQLNTIKQITPIILAMMLWGFSLPGIDPNDFNDYGVVSSLSPLYYLAFLVLCLSFCRIVYRPSTPTILLALHIFALIMLIHGTLPLVYETPRYAWVYKHLGVTEYLGRTGTLDPNLDIYNNWPGFFGYSALLEQISGLKISFFLATWAQVGFNVLNMGALYLAYSVLSKDKHVIWLCIWFFVLCNWIGADYYSPQAFGFFFHCIIIGLFLGFFHKQTTLQFDWLARWEPLKNCKLLKRLVAFLNRLGSMVYTEYSYLGPTTVWQRWIIGLLILAFHFVVVSSHQLTPLMTMIGIGCLVIVGVSRGRLLPVFMVLIFLFWIFGPALAFSGSELVTRVGPVGQVRGNINERLETEVIQSAGRIFVSQTCRILTVSVWAAACLGILWGVRKKRIELIPIVLAFSPMAMIISSYGGEMLFRIYFFTAPWMIFLAVSAFAPKARENLSWWKIGGTIGISVLTFFALLFAYFGIEKSNNLSANELEARNYLYEVAPPGSLIMAINFNVPAKYFHYEQYLEIDTSVIEELGGVHLTADDLPTLVSYMANTDGLYWLVPPNDYFTPGSPYSEAYIMVSRGQYLYADLLSPGTLPDDIAAAIDKSPQFELIYENPDAKIYKLNTELEIQ